MNRNTNMQGGGKARSSNAKETGHRFVKPIRPMSAYDFFLKEERSKILSTESYPTPSSYEDMDRTISERWENLKQGDHLRKYNELAKADSERYKEEMKAFYHAELRASICSEQGYSDDVALLRNRRFHEVAADTPPPPQQAAAAPPVAPPAVEAPALVAAAVAPPPAVQRNSNDPILQLVDLLQHQQQQQMLNETLAASNPSQMNAMMPEMANPFANAILLTIQGQGMPPHYSQGPSFLSSIMGINGLAAQGPIQGPMLPNIQGPLLSTTQGEGLGLLNNGINNPLQPPGLQLLLQCYQQSSPSSLRRHINLLELLKSNAQHRQFYILNDFHQLMLNTNLLDNLLLNATSNLHQMQQQEQQSRAAAAIAASGMHGTTNTYSGPSSGLESLSMVQILQLMQELQEFSSRSTIPR